MVTWPSRDPRRCCEAVRSAILATAWLLVKMYKCATDYQRRGIISRKGIKIAYNARNKNTVKWKYATNNINLHKTMATIYTSLERSDQLHGHTHKRVDGWDNTSRWIQASTWIDGDKDNNRALPLNSGETATLRWATLMADWHDSALTLINYVCEHITGRQTTIARP